MAPTSRAHLVAAGAAAMVLVVAAGPVLVPAALHAAGFGTSGIAAGSWAAAFMRSYGGHVPKDSLFALLQKVGARGLTSSAIAEMEGIAVAMGAAVFFLRRRYFSSKQELSLPELPYSDSYDTPDAIQQAKLPTIKLLGGPPSTSVDLEGGQYRELPMIDDTDGHGSTSDSDDEADDADSTAPLLRARHINDNSQGAEEDAGQSSDGGHSSDGRSQLDDMSVEEYEGKSTSSLSENGGHGQLPLVVDLNAQKNPQEYRLAMEDCSWKTASRSVKVRT